MLISSWFSRLCNIHSSRQGSTTVVASGRQSIGCAIITATIIAACTIITASGKCTASVQKSQQVYSYHSKYITITASVYTIITASVQLSKQGVQQQLEQGVQQL